MNPELLRLARREDWAVRKAPSRPARGARRPVRFRPPRRPEVIDRLDRAGLLPAITFIFSRAGCEAAVRQCLDSGVRLTTPDEVAVITEIAERRTRDIPQADLPVLGYAEWLTGLQRGVAAHHAGMLPTFKEVVEELFEAGLVRAVFATETLALGIDMPARTVVVERLDKWNGETHADLTPGEYTQLTGRAGRPGHRRGGTRRGALAAGGGPTGGGGAAGTRTYPLNSSFRPSYNMAVNLVGQAGLDKAAALLESSFAQFQADRAVVGIARQARRSRAALAELGPSCDLGDYAGYHALREELAQQEAGASRERSAGRWAQARQSLEQLRRGDIILVPGGRRAGLAVVLDPGLTSAHPRRQADQPGPGRGSPDRGSPDRGNTGGRGAGQRGTGRRKGRPGQPPGRERPAAPGAHGQPAGQAALPGRLPDPRHPDRPAAHPEQLQRPLAAAPPGPGREHAHQGGRAGPRPPSPPGRAVAGGGIPAAGRRGRRHHQAAPLRRRRNPSGCPDREMHARQAEQRSRLEREVAGLEGRVAARSHVIARTFDQGVARSG